MQTSKDKLIDELCDRFEVALWADESPRIATYVSEADLTIRQPLCQALVRAEINFFDQKNVDLDVNRYQSLGEEIVRFAESVVTELTNDDENTQSLVTFGKGATDTKCPQIPNYRLVKSIGEGGMGEVWLADQLRPVRRRVAIKLIKSGASSKQVIARFDAERQALAMMDHKNIAKVFDAGVGDDGSPYFAMEYVDGVPITEYCDEHRMTVDGRLRLFISVCKAVQHAHQKGVIHRDLKPSNVLVAKQDSEPFPKVIDFGLAKAIQPTTNLTEQTLQTEFGKVVGTLAYMSPEQSDLNPLDVDTRTDIYSLGAILYELLTGTTPLHHESFKRCALFEVLRKIRESEPQKPSVRVSSINQSIATNASQNRRTTQGKLCNVLRGELDWLVMKAIEKDLVRRYETAIQLSDDVENYLNGDIVEARPPSFSYRFKKFYRKQWKALTALATTFFLLIAAVGVSSYFAIYANRQKSIAQEQQKEADVSQKRSEDVLKLVVNSFSSPDPMIEGRDITVEQALHRVIDQIEAGAIEDDQTKLAMLYTVGRTFVGLDIPQQGRKTNRDAFQLAQRLSSDIDKELFFEIAVSYGLSLLTDSSEKDAKLHFEYIKRLAIERGIDGLTIRRIDQGLANCYQSLGHYAKAVRILEPLYRTNKLELGIESRDTFATAMLLGATYKKSGDLDKALRFLLELHEDAIEELGSDHIFAMYLAANLGDTLRIKGEFGDAEKVLKELLARDYSKIGVQHSIIMGAKNNLALTYIDSGQYEKAVPVLESLIEVSKVKYGATNRSVIKYKNNLASAYENLGRMREAFNLREEVLAWRELHFEQDHPELLTAKNNMMLLHWKNGAIEKALPQALYLLNHMPKVLGEDHPNTITTFGTVARIFGDVGSYEMQTKLRKNTLETSKRILKEQHPNTVMNMYYLGCLLKNEGRLKEAKELLEATLDLQRKILRPGHVGILLSQQRLTEIDFLMGRRFEAQRQFEKVLAEVRASSSALTRESSFMGDVGKLYLAAGESKKAEQYLRLAVAGLAGSNEISRYDLQGILGEALAKQDKYEEAIPLLKDACDNLLRLKREFPKPKPLVIRDALERLVNALSEKGDPDSLEDYQRELSDLEARIRNMQQLVEEFEM